MLISNDTGLQEYLGNITKMIRSKPSLHSSPRVFCARRPAAHRTTCAFLADWLMVHALQKVVVVVTGVNTGETLERWAFDIEADKEITEQTAAPPEKPQQEITKEIQAIMRQITASVTFLPMIGALRHRRLCHLRIRQPPALRCSPATDSSRGWRSLSAADEPCAFEVLLYTDKDAKIDTSTWEESEAKFIANSEEMRLRSFSTKVHQVNTAVSYKVDDF